MTSSPHDRQAGPVDHTDRQRILLAFYRDGKNTCEIGRSLGLHESAIADVLRSDREARARQRQTEHCGRTA